MDEFARFVFTVVLGSFLSFCLVTFLIETVLRLFFLPQGRIAAWIRCSAFIKLAFDVSRYDFGRWCYLLHIDPVSAEKGTRFITCGIGTEFPFSRIEMTLGSEMTFTIADILASYIPRFGLIVFAFGVCLVSVLLFVRAVSASFRFSLVFEGEEYSLHNRILAKACQNKGVRIVLSEEVLIPCVVGIRSPVVYLPRFLDERKQETEAVIAHELEHVRYKDAILFFVLGIIRAVFWWIPGRGMEKKIAEGIEIGCDAGVKKVGIRPDDLASVLYRVALRLRPSRSVCYCSGSFLQKRVRTLLEEPHPPKTIRSWLVILLVTFGVFLGKFWMF